MQCNGETQDAFVIIWGKVARLGLKEVTVMATIDEVATLAKVSVATVSRVMNNSYVVSEEKRIRVLEAAQQLGYQPSTYSRNQKRAESKTILVICSVVIDDVVDGIQATANKLGYDVILNYSTVRSIDLDSVRFLKNGMVDGVILLNSVFGVEDQIRLSKMLPVVQCGEYVSVPNSFQVSTNNEKGANEVVEHLISLGRKRIAFVAPKIHIGLPHFVKEREKGYRMALADHDLPFDPSLIVDADFNMDSGLEAGRRILAMDPRPDAVFCAVDTIAVGCVTAIRDAGLRIPEDIAVAGYDDAEIAQICSPPLTTVSQPYFEIGGSTMRLLAQLINEEIQIGRHIMIDHQLKIRESTVGK